MRLMDRRLEDLLILDGRPIRILIFGKKVYDLYAVLAPTRRVSRNDVLR